MGIFGSKGDDNEENPTMRASQFDTVLYWGD
jgi:hypothetical protein